MKLYLLTSLCLAAVSYAYAQCNGGIPNRPASVTDTFTTFKPWPCCDEPRYCGSIRGTRFLRTAAKYTDATGTHSCAKYADGYADNYPTSPCENCAL